MPHSQQHKGEEANMRARWYIMGGALGAAAIATGLAVVKVDAGQWQTHDKMYFATHPAERHRVMAWCRSDSRHADTYECRNAVAGELSPYVVR